jgi:hypothetical protein
MKTAPGLSATAIRALAHELATRLSEAHERTLRSQPGRIFFPKRIHELNLVDGEAPDGLSPDYLALAARLNGAMVPTGRQDLVDVFLHTVEVEITRARLLEARLIEALEREA